MSRYCCDRNKKKKKEKVQSVFLLKCWQAALPSAQPVLFCQRKMLCANGHLSARQLLCSAVQDLTSRDETMPKKYILSLQGFHGPTADTGKICI